ncbi:hypothetical protein JOC70_001433 [Clostridium pascui]|uniref:DUF2892 domain-containing protein n=1 Tax=Clostridium pascui TaxID=46609 RepID=UPI001957A381|nr:DUF2892 domain-containing protein [Clostridium pascui]MBM7869963.1 hypothetical protein [Clostridium pascui]
MEILTAIEKLLTEDIYTYDRLIPKSVNRVALNTNMKSNEKILTGIYKNIVYYKTKDRNEISKRIDELQREWDTERILEANAAAVILVSLILGKFVDRKWLILSCGVSAFLLQHAIQGWCPPLPIIRSLGKKTPYELLAEITALKILRGDFKDLT